MSAVVLESWPCFYVEMHDLNKGEWSLYRSLSVTNFLPVDFPNKKSNLICAKRPVGLKIVVRI